MRKFIAAPVVAFAMTFVVVVGAASAATAATPVVTTTTVQPGTVVIAQFPDPYGAWMSSFTSALAKMFPDGNARGGVTIIQFGASSSPGTSSRGVSFLYPDGGKRTYLLEGGYVTVTETK